MSADKGRAFLLYKGDGATSEAFNLVGGLRATTLRINGQDVDITDKQSRGWRTLLEDAGVKSLEVTGGGVFENSTAEQEMEDAAYNQTIDNYKLVFAETGKVVKCAFRLDLEYTGAHDNAREYTATLHSSGTPTRSTITPMTEPWTSPLPTS